jgi:hypothetical protein
MAAGRLTCSNVCILWHHIGKRHVSFVTRCLENAHALGVRQVKLSDTVELQKRLFIAR